MFYLIYYRDVDKIRMGIGDKVGQTLYLITVFLAGIVLGFVKSWKLTLVILAISPLIVASAGLMAKVRTVWKSCFGFRLAFVVFFSYL